MEYTTENIDAAAETFRRAEKALLRPDGQPRYGDAEHAERRAGLFAPFDATCEAVDAAVSARITEAEKTLHAIDHFDPLDRLSADDLAAANAKALFVREDAESLSLPELTERLRVAISSGDRPTQYLLARYGDKRAKSVAEAMRQGERGVDTEALHELNAMLREFNALLADPLAASKRTKAETAIREARALRMHASKVHAELSGAQERTMAAIRRQYGI